MKNYTDACLSEAISQCRKLFFTYTFSQCFGVSNNAFRIIRDLEEMKRKRIVEALISRDFRKVRAFRPTSFGQVTIICEKYFPIRVPALEGPAVPLLIFHPSYKKVERKIIQTPLRFVVVGVLIVSLVLL
jgi:hypothetical protein